MKFKYKFLVLSLIFASMVACSNDDYVSNDPNAAPDSPTCYDVNDVYRQYNTFFKPNHGWVGDPMPFYENGTFYVFYLQDARDGADTFHPWYMANTTDLATFTDQGEMIPCGKPSEQDGALGTGSVFKHNGVYYGFYTGHNGNLDSQEKIMLATSTDLKSWVKDPNFELQASDGYDRNEFRDPIIIKDEASNTFRMLLSSRADYKGSWRAVIVQYSSTDLYHWTLMDPFYDDESVFMVECPDVFTEGNYQYLIFSNINDRKVHYRYRALGSGEWITPSNSALDGLAYYAGKSASDGTNRYLFGWCPTREDHSDYNEFGWGGSLITHQLLQQADGTFKVSIPKGVNDKFAKATDLRQVSSGNVSGQVSSLTLNAASQKAFSVFDRQEGAFKITANIKPSTSTSFGFEFGACGNRAETYGIVFDLAKKELRLDRISKTADPVNLTSTELSIASEYKVTIVSENAVCVVYVNGEIAFTNRIYKMNENPWSIFSDNGEITFSDLIISK